MEVVVKLGPEGEAMLLESAAELGFTPPQVLARGLDLVHLFVHHRQRPNAVVVLRAADLPETYLPLEDLER